MLLYLPQDRYRYQIDALNYVRTTDTEAQCSLSALGKTVSKNDDLKTIFFELTLSI